MISKLTDGPRVNADLSRTGAISSRGENRKKSLNAAPWSETWPAPQATLDLDFANDRGYVRGVGQGRSMDAVTFTRSSVGRFVDQDGLLQEAANNTPRFDWASTAQVAQNLLRYTEDFDSTAWLKTNATITADAETAPDNSLTADVLIENTTNGGHVVRQEPSITAGVIYTYSVYVKKANRNWIRLTFGARFNGTAGQKSAWFDIDNGVAGTVGENLLASSISNAGNGWYRVSISQDASLTGPTEFFIASQTANNETTYAGISANNAIYIWGAQLEVGDTATPYIANGAYSTTNTPLAANPTSNGLLIEESRANRLLWCRDATNAAWTKTNVTAAKDQTGIDGVANAASSLTASADGGTCIQTITLGSGSRTGSVFLKRITGTGNVQVTLDGSTWSTVDLSSSEWRRVVLSGTVTNPTVGIRIAVSGDAVAMDYGQVEDGVHETTPILTTDASATRSADNARINNPIFDNFYNQNNSLFVATVKNLVSVDDNKGKRILLIKSKTTTFDRLELLLDSGGIAFNDFRLTGFENGIPVAGISFFSNALGSNNAPYGSDTTVSFSYSKSKVTAGVSTFERGLANYFVERSINGSALWIGQNVFGDVTLGAVTFKSIKHFPVAATENQCFEITR
jgi:hypothetical protein